NAAVGPALVLAFVGVVEDVARHARADPYGVPELLGRVYGGVYELPVRGGSVRLAAAVVDGRGVRRGGRDSDGEIAQLHIVRVAREARARRIVPAHAAAGQAPRAGGDPRLLRGGPDRACLFGRCRAPWPRSVRRPTGRRPSDSPLSPRRKPRALRRWDQFVRRGSRALTTANAHRGRSGGERALGSGAGRVAARP